MRGVESAENWQDAVHGALPSFSVAAGLCAVIPELQGTRERLIGWVVPEVDRVPRAASRVRESPLRYNPVRNEMSETFATHILGTLSRLSEVAEP